MKKGISTLLTICLTAVVALALGAGGWYYIDKQNKDEKAALQAQIDDLNTELAATKVATTTSTSSTSATTSTADTDGGANSSLTGTESASSSSGTTVATTTDTTTALTTDNNGIKVGTVTINNVAIASFQTAVDAGSQPWRLEPLDTAQADALVYGFISSDANSFSIISEAGSAGVAEIAATHNNKSYTISLIKPVPGDGKIWAISEIKAN